MDAQQQLAAKLALHLHQPIARDGAVPDAEDLILLYEGQLDFVRQQQVMSHLINDPDLYQQWLALVEDMALLQPGSVEADAPTETAGGWWPALLARLRGWQGMALGGSLVAASVMLFTVVTAPQTDVLNPSFDASPELHSYAEVSAPAVYALEAESEPLLDPASIRDAVVQGLDQQQRSVSVTLDGNAGIQAKALTRRAPETTFQRYIRFGRLTAEIQRGCAEGLDHSAQYQKWLALYQQLPGLPEIGHGQDPCRQMQTVVRYFQ